MPTIKNTFHLQTMDKETDKAFVESGRTRHNENLRFGTNGGNDGIGVNIKGTVEIADLTDDNSDFKCIGARYNESNNTIYYMLATTDGAISKVAEYNLDGDASALILHDTTSILNLKKGGYITGINEIDGLLFFSEWGNNPRRINIERAKGYGIDGFTEEDIQLSVIPPHQKLKITLQDSGNEENHIKEKMFSFSYQWRYLDGEYSILAPFTEFAFHPEDFEYDFSEQSHKAMVNKFNQVKIEFDTGNERVTEIRLVFKESASNSEWIIDDFEKASLGYGDNEIKEFIFDNGKTYRALSDTIIRNYSNGVPLTNKAQTIINGRLILGNFKEYYNLEDGITDGKINFDYSVELVDIENTIRGLPISGAVLPNILTSTIHATTLDSLVLTITSTGLLAFGFVVDAYVSLVTENNGFYSIVSVTDTTLVLLKEELPYPLYSGAEATTLVFDIVYPTSPSLVAKRTVKSNRSYEIGLVYLDTPCRSTTILNSKTNTVFVSTEYSVTENALKVTLNHLPPYWAKYFRFFVRQPQKKYEQIIPSFFYEDNVYRWIKIEGSEFEKIKEGQFLIVKSDSQGIKTSLIKTKVLEVKYQEKNFLQPASVNTSIDEVAGWYFKVKPEGYRINKGDYEKSVLSTYTTSQTGATSPKDHLIAGTHYLGAPNFYGDTLDDLTASGTYVGNEFDRSRYNIFIDTIGATDTFIWNEDGGSLSAPIAITGGAQLLNNGISITFGSITGHSESDEWTVSARAGVPDDRAKGFAFFRKNIDAAIPFDLENEKIYIGDIIRLKYDEYNNESRFFEILITSNGEYNNIEEWFYKENVLAEMQGGYADLTMSTIFFVRGEIVSDILVESLTSYMTIVIRSQGTQNNGVESRVMVKAETEILSQDGQNILLFETETKDENSDISYEIGRTYPITAGLHQADKVLFPLDQHQADISTPLIVTLDWFNAFSYGNGVESYKIKDEFNGKGLDVGVRTLTATVDEYKEILRLANATWSDVYRESSSFNGLGTFNNSLINFIELDKESGSIQLLHNSNGNLKVYQQDAIGILPYNKNVIYDTQGGKVVGVSNNVLDEKSYEAYASGRYGTRHPESFVARGNREYIIDDQRGKLLRMSTDGATPISDNKFEHYFSRLMAENKNTFMVGGYDPKHGEYLFNIKNTSNVEELQSGADNTSTYSYKEKAGGFPTVYTFEPDFMLEANNEIYAWKNGVMYKLNASETRNNFFGSQYSSVLKFFVNQEFSVEKIFNTIGIEGTHAWLTKLKTKLTSRTIKKESFTKIEDYWYSEIMGNTNTNSKSNSSFGLGNYSIISGVIETTIKYPSLSIGDYIKSNSLTFPKSKVTDITDTEIVLEDAVNAATSFLIYLKNQNVDGGEIRGDILEVEMISNETEKIELRAVNVNVTKSNIS